MTLRELARRVDAREFNTWISYDAIEPLPDSWAQTGLLASLQWNLHTSRETPKRSPDSFIPRAVIDDEDPTPEQQRLAILDFDASIKAMRGKS